MNTLQLDSEVVTTINEKFRTIVKKHGIFSMSFQEGRGMGGYKGVQAMVSL